MPPTPWHGKTSRVSSRVDRVFEWTAALLRRLATNPTRMLCCTLT